MYKRLRVKIVLILVLFIFSVMTVVGTILLNNVFVFYTDGFVRQMDQCFTPKMKERLTKALASVNYETELYDILNAFSGQLGIDVNRDFYVLDASGEVLKTSSSSTNSVKKTNNLLSAINGRNSSKQLVGSDVMDYALCLSANLTESDDVVSTRSCIIYISDTREEMHEFAWTVFTIIMQALIIGLVIALVLSFSLSRAITSPILDITKGAAKLASGDFSEKLPVHSRDEIGVLTRTFNKMAGELKRTLDEVTGEREKLETIFAYLNDGVVAFDPSGAPIQINQTAVKLLDLSETKKGIPLGEFISLLSLPTSSEVIFSPDFRSIAFREISYKGKMIDISIGKFNIELDNKPYGGIIAVLHDVSEHFELEKSRREFVATVSHELRTPLTGIKGATESVIEDPDMPPEIRAHFLEMVVNESDRMTRIVRDLLMISRLDNNRLSWDPSYFDPAALMRDCVEMLGTEAGQHRHSLVASCSDESVPMLYADRERTAQVMINVIQNAIKYTPDGGNIAISVFYRYCDNIEGLPKANYVVYIVKDNGIGIPKEDIPHIFDRFYRVEKARSSQTGGTGLGLSIANEIVCAHGGKIVIESELDKGTTVYIFIPEAHTVNSAGKNGANTEINGTRKP